MKYLLCYLLFGFLFLLYSPAAQGQDFVYRPINPAFGGNYLNYQWLLSSAQAQSEFKEVVPERDIYRRDPLEDFQSSLSRQLLNQISRQVMTDQFGEGSLDDGNYVFGNFEIEVTSGVDGLIINILDTTTGGETTITIPHF